MIPDELVLGVPRARLWVGAAWRGVRTTGIEAQLEVARVATEFRPRAEAERDPAWKQLIPYLLLRDGSRLFLMRRTRAGGDARLHERFSIGVGGHINPGDGGIEGALAREWREEIDADFAPPFRFVGLLNDDSEPVGEVHLGFVFEADVAGRRVGIRERDKLSGAFVDVAGLRAVRDRMESWSVLLLDHLADTGAL